MPFLNFPKRCSLAFYLSILHHDMVNFALLNFQFKLVVTGPSFHKTATRNEFITHSQMVK